MSNPPALSAFEHRVSTVAYLLAVHICMSRDLSRATNGELHNILIGTLEEARQDTSQRSGLRVPWSRRLSAFWDMYRVGFRARQAFLHKLIFMWLGIVIGLPIYLLLNITQIRRTGWWSLKLLTRWATCLRDHHEQSVALLATIRDRAQQQLPDLTNKEADWMVVQIAILAVVAGLLGVVHDM